MRALLVTIGLFAVGFLFTLMEAYTMAQLGMIQ